MPEQRDDVKFNVPIWLVSCSGCHARSPATWSPPMTDITLYLARAANGVIGADGTLPWRLPAD
ncbi:MAG TPA: hypothetical protein VL973_09865, partial [Sphingomonas sp.]|nr:hypothetical protein [Sphingomonas sp.]